MWEPKGKDSEEKLHLVGAGRGTEGGKGGENQKETVGEAGGPGRRWGEMNFDGAGALLISVSRGGGVE